MKQEPEINLFSVTIELFSEHLAYAIDQLRLAIEIPKSNHPEQFRVEWRYATSSMIYGFSALDGLANYLGFELFINEGSEHFIKDNERSYALKQLLKSWRRFSVLNKVELILAETRSDILRPNIAEKLNELNTMRNWLVHGLPYTINYLEETTWSGMWFTSTLHDMEDNFERSKFPNTKFNSPARLNMADAKTSIIIVLEVITFILSQIKWFHTSITTMHKMKKEYWLDGNSSVAGILSDFQL
ncbi:MAG: hypothetical protein HYR70_08795 [Chloroflexi bacterium]|nr:hypothetical protein [Chloroflexota bacterium]MBI3339072.1 hypothetical protein [Chloroflexota bacterium]